MPIPDIPKSGLGGKASTDKAYALSHFVQSFDCHKNENRGPYPIIKKGAENAESIQKKSGSFGSV